MANYPMLSLAGAPTDGINEVQRLTPGGTITGGSFKLTFETKQTAVIPWNATAAQVKAALEALANVNVGDVIVTGGPIDSAFVAVEFTLNLGGALRTEMTVQSSLTGTDPTLTPSSPTGGQVGSYRGAQPGAILQDITNGILYRNVGTRATPNWEVPTAEPVWVLTP